MLPCTVLFRCGVAALLLLGATTNARAGDERSSGTITSSHEVTAQTAGGVADGSPGGDVLRPSRGAARASGPSLPLRLTIDAGVSYTMFSQNMTWSPQLVNSPLATFKSAAGFSPYASIGLDIPLTPTFSIQPRLSYEPAHVTNETTGACDCVVQGVPPDVVDAAVNHEFTMDADYIGLGVALRLKVTETVFLFAAPMVQFLMGNPNVTSTMTITSPEACSWLDEFGNPSGEKVMKSDSEIQNAEKQRFGVELGAGLDLPLTETIAVVPQVRYALFVTKFKKDDTGFDTFRNATIGPSIITESDASLNRLTLTVGLWFKL